jgi:CHASE2 domain-containing sensor protein
MKNIWLQSFIITGFVFGLLWSANQFLDLKLFGAFDVIGSALKDFQLTDYAFSKLRAEPVVEQRIVLVNIGDLSRREVAQQIQIINQFKPKVIGIDALYNCEGNLRDTVDCPQLLDTLGNLMLSQAIKEAGNVVMAEKLLQTKKLALTDTDVFDSLEYSDPVFRLGNVHNGFVSLPTEATYQEDVKLCRTIFPQFSVNGKRELYFGTQIAMQYDSVKANKFLARDKQEELINFRGNIEVVQLALQSEKADMTGTSNYPTLFYAVDANQLLRGEFFGEMFKNNIVIMGYLGKSLGDPSWNDKFFTPLNKKVAGRANPDMFGVVLHANVVTMILNDDYIDELSSPVLIGIALITCFFTVALLIVIDNKLPSWFDALSFFVQIILLLLTSGIIIWAFVTLSYKLDLTLTVGAFALVGPGYDIFKSLQNEYIKRFTKPKPDVLKE